MRLALAALLSLAACGGAARSAPMPGAAVAPSAEPAAEPAAPESTEPTTDAPGAAELAATDSAAPAAATPTPDTPMCRTYKQIVAGAPGQFADAGAAKLPGATTCTVVSGGPGQAATATYTCEFGTAADPAQLAPKRDELDRALSSCGSQRARIATRVRVVTGAGDATLVVNVHDSARW